MTTESVSHSRVLLRAFLRCRDDGAVSRLQPLLLQALDGFGPRWSGPPERYAKLPEWVEFTLDLAPATRQTFDAVTALQPLGWTHGGDDDDRSSVWVARPRLRLLRRELKWAELIFTQRR